VRHKRTGPDRILSITPHAPGETTTPGLFVLVSMAVGAGTPRSALPIVFEPGWLPPREKPVRKEIVNERA
jgi:hypothetical protein